MTLQEPDRDSASLHPSQRRHQPVEQPLPQPSELGDWESSAPRWRSGLSTLLRQKSVERSRRRDTSSKRCARASCKCPTTGLQPQSKAPAQHQWPLPSTEVAPPTLSSILLAALWLQALPCPRSLLRPKPRDQQRLPQRPRLSRQPHHHRLASEAPACSTRPSSHQWRKNRSGSAEEVDQEHLR